MFRPLAKSPLRGVGARSTEYISHSGQTPGMQGQLTRCQKYTKIVGDPDSTDRFNWALNEIARYCVLDWYDTDGTSPEVGGTLDASGSITSGKPTPFKNPDGSYLTRSLFSTDAKYEDLSFTDPGDSDDILAITLAAGHLNASRFISTYGASGNGFQMLFNPAAGNSLQCVSYGATAVGSVAPIPTGALMLAAFQINRGGNQFLYVNGVSFSEVAAPSGSLASGKVGIGARPGTTPSAVSSICRVLLFYGDLSSICDADWHRELPNSVFGNISHNSGQISAFTRNSTDVIETNSNFFYISQHMPCIGEDGYQAKGSQTNKLFDTHFPTGNGWAVTGGTKSVANDWTSMESNGIFDFGPYGIQLANSSGSDQILYNLGTIGNTNPHSINIRTRIAAGSGIEYGWRDSSSGVFTKVGDCNDNYTETISNNLTPPDTDVQFAIKVPNGATVITCAATVVEADFVTTPILNPDDSSTETRAESINTSGLLPDSEKGQISADVETINWSGTASADRDLFAASTSGGLWGTISSGDDHVTTDDGTSQVQSDAAAMTGSSQRVLTSWGGRKIHVSVEGKGSDEEDFDGDMDAVGNWDFGGKSSASPNANCKNLSLRRNAGSLEE